MQIDCVCRRTFSDILEAREHLISEHNFDGTMAHQVANEAIWAGERAALGFKFERRMYAYDARDVTHVMHNVTQKELKQQRAKELALANFRRNHFNNHNHQRSSGGTVGLVYNRIEKEWR